MRPLVRYGYKEGLRTAETDKFSVNLLLNCNKLLIDCLISVGSRQVVCR